MVDLDAPRRRRSADRGWAIAAASLWLAAAVLAAVYLWDVREDASATAETVTSRPALEVASTSAPVVSRTVTSLSSTTTTTQAPTTTEPPTTTTTEPATTTSTSPPALLVAAGGDVLGDRLVGDFLDAEGGEALFKHVRPFLASGHMSFVNLEGPISDKGTRASWKEYTFRARPALLDGLVSAGIDVVSLANNHSMDYGAKALLDTLARLDDAGVCYAGAGADAAAASAPALLISPAGTIAVLAFTDIIPGGFTATVETAGVCTTTPDRKKLLSAVAAANERADFVVVSFHWGTEYDATANQAERKLAHQVVEAGADLVLGHHPHVIQGLEVYRDRLIVYSMGDFIWDHYSVETGETFVLRVALEKQGPPSAEIIPVYLDESTGVPSPVTGDHAASILGRLARLSADLGLDITTNGDRAYFGADPPVGP